MYQEIIVIEDNEELTNKLNNIFELEKEYIFTNMKSEKIKNSSGLDNNR